MDTTDLQPDSEALRKMQSASQPQHQPVAMVVIQELPSQLYLSDAEARTPDIDKAKMFDTSWAAIDETTHLKLRSFKLVTTCKPEECDFNPVGTRSAGSLSDNAPAARHGICLCGEGVGMHAQSDAEDGTVLGVGWSSLPPPAVSFVLSVRIDEKDDP